ncbi:MAG: hypothetical protein OEY60_17590 [Nitrospira sp.]|jgi:hypothetical protein|nr:hypothetical protein [Nitrospira sp.]
MNTIHTKSILGAALAGWLAFTTTLFAQEAVTNNEAKETELAMKLQNPISNLISVPFQSNFDFGAGPKGDGFQYKLNIQPVIPFSISKDWNLIGRMILPVISQHNVISTSSQSGLSDTVLSLFFSPKAPTSGGWIWGAGPVLLLPTATDNLLGTEKWGAGPTAVVLKQDGGWTYGALANHILSYTGTGSRQSVNSTFLQPFVSYTTKQQTSYDVSTESSYDWANHQWTVPLLFTVAQLVTIGETPVQFQLGARYYAEKPANGPEWGLRFGVVLLFPK